MAKFESTKGWVYATDHFPVPLDEVLERDGGGHLDGRVRGVVRAQEGQQEQRVALLILHFLQEVLGRLAKVDLWLEGVLQVAGKSSQILSVDLHDGRVFEVSRFGGKLDPGRIRECPFFAFGSSAAEVWNRHWTF